MKQVLTEIPVQNFTLQRDVSKFKNYGVDLGQRRGFITKTNYYDGSYCIRSTTCLTAGCGFSDFSENIGSDWSLYEYIKWLVECKKVKVFEFDKVTDLMSWADEPEFSFRP